MFDHIIFIGFGIILIIAILLLIFYLATKWKERNEQVRARRLGYRVKFIYGGHGGDCFVEYTSGDLERKFDVKWVNGKRVVNLSVPYVRTFSSPEGYWETMRDRIILELKRLFRDKIEIIT